jgi:hypothetical protein
MLVVVWILALLFQDARTWQVTRKPPRPEKKATTTATVANGRLMYAIHAPQRSIASSIPG